jgi:hypothetical protein
MYYHIKNWGGENMKKTVVSAIMLVAMILTLGACGAKTAEIDVSNMIYLGRSDYFENQEVAEAALTAKGIPYTVVEAGTKSTSSLAEVNAEYISNPKDGQYCPVPVKMESRNL